MANLVYIGNYLESSRSNTTYMHRLGSLLEQEGHAIVYASSKRNQMWRMLDMIATVFKHRSQCDYVLIDTYSTKNFYYAYIISYICQLFSLKYIPILHGGNLPSRLRSSKKMSQRLFQRAHRNVSPSNYLLHEFNKERIENVEHIPNSIEIETYRFQEKRPDSIKVLWVRSFSKIYNPRMALETVKELKVLGYSAELCMIGPDSDGSLESLKQLASDLNVNVVFPGKLTRQEWMAKAKDYSVFINTTNFDNTPLSVIEAMALGLPVVSTNVGGIPYLIENDVDGILVEPNDSIQMAQAIRNLFENPRKKEGLVLKAREKVKQFDWSIVKTKWNALLAKS